MDDKANAIDKFYEAVKDYNGLRERIADLERQLAEAQQARERLTQEWLTHRVAIDSTCVEKLRPDLIGKPFREVVIELFTQCDTLRGLLRDTLSVLAYADLPIQQYNDIKERITAALKGQ